VNFFALGPITRGGIFPGDGLARRLQRGTDILEELPWGSFIVGGDHLRFPAFAPGAKRGALGPGSWGCAEQWEARGAGVG
jgi:hypothetical protein